MPPPSIMRLCALGAILLTAACAQGARTEAMIARAGAPMAENSSLRSAIAIGSVSGGQATNPLWTSQVSNEDFAAALRASLSAQALIDLSGRRFRIDAVLTNLSQPLVGFDMTVTAVVTYRFTEVATGRVAFDRVIATPFTATFGASVIGVERLRLANEGAIRENISALISALMEAERINPQAFRGNVRGGGGNSGFGRGVGFGWPSDLAARVELRSSHP
jgi:hypothetical protein